MRAPRPHWPSLVARHRFKLADIPAANPFNISKRGSLIAWPYLSVPQLSDGIHNDYVQGIFAALLFRDANAYIRANYRAYFGSNDRKN